MNKILATLLVALMLTVSGSRMVRAGPLEDAGAAYQRHDYATALRLLQPYAAQGDASAQYNLGLMYEKGLGVPQDYNEAVKLYRLAAAQGNAPAQSNLGSMLPQSNGTLTLVNDLADAQVNTSKGVLECSTCDPNTYSSSNPVFPKGAFHPYDYSFYYNDLSTNAKTRVNRYLAQH